MTLAFRCARVGAIAVLGFAVAACGARDPQGPPLATVPRVDLARYAGQWYEIARDPNRFQSQCAGDVTASYTRRARTGRWVQ